MTSRSSNCASCASQIPEGSLYCPSCGATTPTEISQETGTVRRPATENLHEDEQRERVQRALGDGFELGRLLGRGGFAEVYAATDLKLQRTVAIKVLRPDLVVNRSLTERFLREARAAAKLRNPNIIPIYQVGEAEGLAYFLMPLIEGESLREYMERVGQLPIEESRRVLREVAEALAVAHDAGLVHRDIKPDNIMLEGKERRAIVTDFGIAKALGSSETGLTGTGMIVGTPHYMSPEQASGEKEIDSRSDIYSLGVVAYQMLTGRLPFEGETTQEVLVKQVTTRAAPVQALRKDLPVDIASAVNRMLEKGPSERWQSCSDFARALTSQSPAKPEAAARPWHALTRSRIGHSILRIGALVAIGVAILALSSRVASRLGIGGSPRRSTRGTAFSGLRPEAQTANDALRPAWLRAIGDSVLTASVVSFERRGGAARGLWVFDGVRWFQTGPYEAQYSRPTQVGSTHIFVGLTSGRGGARRYQWAGRDLRLLDTVSIVPTAYWSDGRTEIMGDGAGGIFRRSGSDWIREPTGTTRWIMKIAGRDGNHLVAIVGGIPDTVPDSLLVYDGSAWRSLDPRTGTSARVDFSDITTLSDGPTVVVGDARSRAALASFRSGNSPDFPASRPAVLTQDSPGGRWTELSLGLPDSLEVSRIWGRSTQDFYVWSRWLSQCASRVGCVYHVLRGRAEPVGELAGVSLVDMTLFRGSPHALADDGRVWREHGGHWSPVLELPRAVIRYLAAAPLLDVIAAADSGGLLNLGGGVGEFLKESVWIRHTRFPGHTRGIDARDSTLVLLSDSAVIRWSCHPARTIRTLTDVVCDQDTLRAPGASNLLAVGIVDRQNVLAAGVAGMLVQWTERRPEILGVPVEARSDTLGIIVRGSGGKTFVLGSRSVLVVQGGRALLAGRRAAADGLRITSAAALDDSTLIVAGRREGRSQDEVAAMPIARPENLRRVGEFATTARVHVLGDGRIVVGVATPDDPAAGGSLHIHTPPGPMWQNWVEVPMGFDVYGVADDGKYLYATGSGWQFARIRLDSLPVAPPRRN